jgi:ribosomal protein L7/L12
MPPEVEALARGGKMLEAMKLYREVTGASFDQAKAAVTAL